MRRPVRSAGRPATLLAALALLAVACTGDVDGASDAVAPEPVAVDESLGVVRLAPGERIQLLDRRRPRW